MSRTLETGWASSPKTRLSGGAMSDEIFFRSSATGYGLLAKLVRSFNVRAFTVCYTKISQRSQGSIGHLTLSVDAVPKKRGPKTDVLEALLKRVDGLEQKLKEKKEDPSSDDASPTQEEDSSAPDATVSSATPATKLTVDTQTAGTAQGAEIACSPVVARYVRLDSLEATLGTD